MDIRDRTLLLLGGLTVALFVIFSQALQRVLESRAESQRSSLARVGHHDEDVPPFREREVLGRRQRIAARQPSGKRRGARIDGAEC